ncbi:MAG: 5-(carboxyamino)imidazole ribonucleotide synthase [Chloroflexaceae bacterium]|nr:5-(carboxyamino)imidazole ribonucleotide synthase [Chloroflexaceae bacterium]
MNATIGIVGGGQLGRMLALAGYPLGLRFRFFDPSPDATAGEVGELIYGAYDDTAMLARFVDGLDVITYEFENVPVATARTLVEHCPVYPPMMALSVAQDRLHEKTFFRRLGIPTPPFHTVDSHAELETALKQIGLPAVLKTRRMGYDGKGQAVLNDPADVEAAWERMGTVPLILEGFMQFEREVSVIGVRSTNGTITFYPLTENAHTNGILSSSIIGTTPDPLQTVAETTARRVLTALDYVGVLAIEFFQVGGKLFANEMAPRVHNSGHWTIEGAETSQFANHLRAILGLPLGSTAPRGAAAMLNLIGSVPDVARVLAVPGAALHWYNKAPRPGRKLGHITLCTRDDQTLSDRLEHLRAICLRLMRYLPY